MNDRFSSQLEMRRNTMDELIVEEIFGRKVYLKDFVLPYVKKDGIIIDIGSHIGAFTIQACKVLHPRVVVSIEPDRSNFDCLLKNIAKAKCEGVVRPMKIAIWNRQSTLKLYQQASNTGGSSLLAEKIRIEDNVEPSGSSSILADTLDNVLRKLQLAQNPIELIKIDVEGSERQVLQGSVNALNRATAVVGELHQALVSERQLRKLMKNFVLALGEPVSPLEIRAFWAINKRVLKGKAAISKFIEAARATDLEDTVWRLRRRVTENIRLPSANKRSSLQDPISVLLRLYYERKDLQEAFPEVISGKYDRLVNWGKSITTSKQDEAHRILASFEHWYENNPFSELASQEQRIRGLEEAKSASQTELTKLHEEISQRDSRIRGLEEAKSASQTELTKLHEEILPRLGATINQLESEITVIRDSFGYRLMRFYARMLHFAFPENTRRGELRRILVASVHVIMRQGLRAYLGQVFQKLSRGEFRLAESPYVQTYQADRVRLPRNTLASTEVESVRKREKERKMLRASPIMRPTISDDWKDYWDLSRKISEAERTRLQSLPLKPPQMTSVDDKEMVAHAKSLRFQAVEKPEVSIIIPVCNRLKVTIECLTSILRNTNGVPYELIVIDDDSTEKTKELLSQIRGVRYLKNPKNLGFLLSCNRAAREARGKFLLILHNDVQVTKDWLPPLVDTFLTNENVGAVGPKILHPNGRLQAAGARIRQNESSHLLGLYDAPDLPRYNYLREVEYCPDICLFLSTEKFAELDGFDTSFALGYQADADLCFRLRRQGLRTLYAPGSVIVHNLSSTPKADSSYEQLETRNRQLLCEKWKKQIDDLNRVRLIAFYLPQYYPIPENDLWWGKGFTEWTNVTKARPNFVGHHQPRLPADLGFYDLRVEDVIEQQAELAKRYGVHGFCFHYYRFGSKRLLELPLERMLKTSKPDIPFCIMWANESWTRTWEGQEDEILIKQRYSEENDRAVIIDIMRYMRHPNYIRVNGKPLLVVYRAGLLPNAKRTTEIWRELCRKEGIGEVYLIMAEAFEFASGVSHPSKYGFDASLEYPLFRHPAALIGPPGDILNPEFAGKIYDYRDIVLMYTQEIIPGYTRFRSVIVDWDNTARRQNVPRILVNSSPGAYQAWLESVLEHTLEQNFGEESILFINAWNEWAEGNYLEPDRRFGHGFLEATHNALERALLK
jgi:FkbM family methyltransferase